MNALDLVVDLEQPLDISIREQDTAITLVKATLLKDMEPKTLVLAALGMEAAILAQVMDMALDMGQVLEVLVLALMDLIR